MSLRVARDMAFQALFQIEFNHGESSELEFYENLAIETVIDECKSTLRDIDLDKLKDSVKGTLANLGEIDELIKKYLKEGWTFDRVTAVDRNILRLAVYEMKFAEEKLPAAIAINEAVKLAKKYGTDDSSKFVNGILDAISK